LLRAFMGFLLVMVVPSIQTFNLTNAKKPPAARYGLRLAKSPAIAEPLVALWHPIVNGITAESRSSSVGDRNFQERAWSSRLKTTPIPRHFCSKSWRE